MATSDNTLEFMQPPYIRQKHKKPNHEEMQKAFADKKESILVLFDKLEVQIKSHFTNIY